MSSAAGFVLITLGLAFDVLGCAGLVRFADVYSRLQSSVKCVTLGTCCILFGTFLTVGFTAAGMKMLVCAWLLLLMSPTAAHALARASHKTGIRPSGEDDK